MSKDNLIEALVADSVAKIRHIIENFGPRDPGSPGEKKAQDYFAEALAACADEVRREEFTVHPRAFMGFTVATGLLFLAATALYWIAPVAALPLSLLALTVAIVQFLMYRRFLDPLFPRRTSTNVLAVRRSSGETRRRIIISGHADAAYEWRFFISGGGILLKTVIIGALACGLAKIIFDLIAVVSGNLVLPPAEGAFRFMGLVQLAGIPFFLGLIFFSNYKVISPGANDNLTGSLVALKAMKYLHQTGTRFEHTEVQCLITGSEEAGLRGAKAYAEKHASELKEMETVFIALETFRDLEHLSVYNRDMSGTVRHDPETCALLQQAGKNCGFQLPLASVYLGSTDAAAFSQAGIPAAALAAMDPAPPRYYHTRLDHWDNLNPDCLEAALRITLEAIKLYDAAGRKAARPGASLKEAAV